MLDAPSEAIDALLRAHVPGGPLTRAFYVSQTVHEADLERIWRSHWLFAGLACQIPLPGDRMTWSVGSDTVLLVRGNGGAVRAFHNVCRHRGARLCADETGHGRLIVCPYHAWSYELDGRLRIATEAEFGVAQNQLGLLPVQVRSIAGLLFIALGPDPEPFEAAMTTIAPKMAQQGLEEARVAHRIRYRVRANWKLVFENNRECYHCATAHPEYVRATYDVDRLSPGLLPEVERQEQAADRRFRAMGLDGAVASSAMTGPWWRCTRAPLMEGWQTQSLDGRPVSTLMGRMRSLDAWSCGTLRTTMFPNFWQHASDDHAVATRLNPVDATTTEIDVIWLVHRDAQEGRDYTLERLLPFWQRTSEQDWAICEAQQAGVTSPAYVPGPYSLTRETNVAHFIDWYLAALAGRRQT
jgi:Rieske 2Fe-2S family protein